MEEGERDSSRTRFGASTIILQSSATTHRHFFAAPNRGDVKIALMVDQREKPRFYRYLSFSRAPLCVSPTDPVYRHRHSVIV